jgi:Cohesin domain
MHTGGIKNKLFWALGFALCFLTAGFSANNAQAASLYLSPSSGSYGLGETFQISMYVSSADQAMNAAEASVSFPNNILEVISVSTKNSIFSLMVESPSFSNANGSAGFSGIVLNPGYTGKSGKLVTLNFKAKALGKATVSIGSANVLANDGAGTSILTSRGSGTYTIIEIKKPVVPEPVKPVVTTPKPTPTVTTTPTTTPEIPLVECATTTVNIVTSTACTSHNLPYIFLKIGDITFDESSLFLLFLILIILVSAVLSFWGFFEAYIHRNEVEKIHKHAPAKKRGEK